MKKCRNIGCSATFVHSMQLTRYKKKCEHAVSPSDRSYIFSGETQLFECVSCSKTFTKQSNASRHAKKGCKKKEIVVWHICLKTFTFKSQLKAHIKTHEQKQSKICDKCNKYFARQKSFSNHVKIGCDPASVGETVGDESICNWSLTTMVESYCFGEVDTVRDVYEVSEVRADNGVDEVGDVRAVGDVNIGEVRAVEEVGDVRTVDGVNVCEVNEVSVSKRNFATYRQVKRRSVGIEDIIT